MDSGITLLPKYLWNSSFTLEELKREITYNVSGHDLYKKSKIELLVAEWHQRLLRDTQRMLLEELLAAERYSKILSKSKIDGKKNPHVHVFYV